MNSSKAFVPTRLTLVAVLLASTLVLLGGAAVAPALDMIRDHFGVEDTIMTLVVTLPSLGVATTGLITGMLGDKIGKVKVLIMSLLIFGVAGAASFVATDINLLLVERYIVGVGIGGIGGSCSALLTLYYEGEARVKALSLQTAAMGLGVLILEVGGGMLAGIGWNGPFLIYTIGIFIAILALIALREPTVHFHGGEMPKMALRKDVVALCYVAIFVNSILMFAIPSMLAAYITDVQGASDSVIAGVLLGFNGVINAAVCVSYRKIIRYVPVKILMTLAWLLFALGYLMFLLPGTTFRILLSTCFVGMGIGLGSTFILNTLSSSTPPHMAGKIMGGYTMSMNIGMFSSTFLTAALVAFTGSYGGMYVAIGVISLVVAILILPAVLRITRN